MLTWRRASRRWRRTQPRRRCLDQSPLLTLACALQRAYASLPIAARVRARRGSSHAQPHAHSLQAAAAKQAASEVAALAGEVRALVEGGEARGREAGEKLAAARFVGVMAHID